MTQPSTPPALPAPLNGAGKTINQRIADIEVAVNGVLSALPGMLTAQVGAALKPVQAAQTELRATLDADRAAAEKRHAELLKAVAASAQPPIQFPDLSGLQKDVKLHGEKIAALEGRAAPAAPDLSGITARLDALENAPEIELPEVESVDLAPLEGRVAALEDALGLTAQATQEPEPAPAGTPLDPATPGYAAYLADGRYTTAEAIQAATDEELDAVKGIGPSTIADTRIYLKGVNNDA